MDISLEDGEISNDSDSYTPLKRPDNYSTFSNPIIAPQVVDNDSDSAQKYCSDSGSDSDCATKQKRLKLKPKSTQAPTRPVNHKYNIWSTRIQEEVLVDTLNTCDVTKKDRSRDVESYDFPVREDYGNNVGGSDLRELLSKKNKERTKKERKNNKRSRDDRSNQDLRLIGKRQEEDDDGGGVSRYLVDLSVTLDSTEEDIAKDLANKLYETKEDLLLKAVTVLGKEKSLKIFKDVKRIEKEGGMLIMNQSRRRTPGGVYLFLVRHDSEITRDQQDRIFDEDKQKSKNKIRAKRKSSFSKAKSKILGKNIPELLKRGELSLKKIEEISWNNEKVKTDHEEVENPPPTPETDCPDNTEDDTDRGQDNKILIDEVSGRQRQEYDEDFLDLGNANDMDLF